MDYNEVLQRARVRMAPRCKVCPECNGLGCGNTMPGPGSKAPGNGANDNWRAWRRWCLNMDTIAPNTPVDTSLELLGRTFSLPVIAAPIGSLRAQFNPEDDIRDYNACCIAAAAQTGIAASFGDGLDARVFPHGCALSQQYGGIGLPVINPLSMDTIRANLDLANAARPFAVSVVIDSAGLPHLKAASPDAGSKTVAELRELCGYAQMPMILKGIMTVRGAEKAVEAGAAAIVVSNHGGRVLPGSAATADVLPEIADAVGDRVKILVDGGIRSGTDIFRALALGADAVMICRPFLISYYGGGTEGIVAYVKELNAGKTAVCEPIYFKDEMDKIEVEVAIQFVDTFEENLLGFCNNIFTQEGGTHLAGFKTKFTALINSYAREIGILKDKDTNFTGADTRNGMTAVIAVKHPDPIFERSRFRNADFSIRNIRDTR